MAWRNLWRNKRRTLLTLLSIVFGTFLAILFTAMQDRNWAETIDLAARLGGGHTTLQHPEYLDMPSLTRTVGNGDRLRELALEDPDVDKAVMRISGQAMLATASASYGALIIAYDPEVENETTLSFLEGLVEGEMFDSPTDKGIILGSKLAQNLQVQLGRKVVYTLIDKNGDIVTGMGRLSGVVATGAPSIDAGLGLLPLDTLRDALDYEPDESTQVAVFLSDSRASAAVARRLGNSVGDDVSALTWEESQPQLAGFIAMKVGGARVMELIIALLVAAGIFNTLFVSVMERMREFGIMMALGFSPAQLFRLVLWESLWLGAVGMLAGLAVTAGPYFYLAKTGIDMSGMFGASATEVAGVGMPMVIKVGIYPENAALICAAVLIATLAAGLYPAWRAGHVAPVESISLV